MNELEIYALERALEKTRITKSLHITDFFVILLRNYICEKNKLLKTD